MRRKITVFGGSGFIGRHLVRRLAAKGDEVRVAVRDIEAAQYLKPAGEIGQVVLWQTDIKQPAQVANAVEGADAVVNLVGALSEWRANTFPAVHIEGAKNIAEAASAAGVKHMVHVSALGANTFSESLYARTKAMGEEAVQAAFPSATILRPSVIFGPEDGFFNLFAGLARVMPFLPVFGCPLLPKVSVSGENGLTVKVDLFGDGGTKFQPIYVGDVAEAITVSLETPTASAKTYEIGGPAIYSFKQMMELLLTYTGRKKWLLPIPIGLAMIDAYFLQLLPKPLITCDQLILLKSDNVVSEGAETLDALGIKPVAAETILPTYLHRFRTGAAKGLQNA
jgi:uncharacterized protein YbjT (DUF2867 family)